MKAPGSWASFVSGVPTLHEEGTGASVALACGMASKSRSRRLPVLLARARPQGLAPARQEHGPQQQRLHAAREGGVTGLDAN